MLGIAVLLWVSCGETSAPHSGPQSNTASSNLAPASVVPSTRQGQKEVELIYYAVQGGFTGLNRSTTIATDGATVWDSNDSTTNGSIALEDLDTLKTELDNSGLFDRDREFPAPHNMADLQRYEVRYKGATVVAYDLTIPPELSQAIAHLNEISLHR